MQNEIDAFVAGLKENLGANLVSATLYGSAARGENSRNSNVNVLILVKQLRIEYISALEKTFRRGEKSARIAPVIWTEAELRESLDVFPIEFEEILANRRVLYGPDAFENLAVDGKNLRHQVEFEIRGKILRLRAEWLNVKGRRAALEDFLGKAGTSFLRLYASAQKVAAGKIPEELAGPFKTAIGIKKGETKLSERELEKLFLDMHDSAGRIAAAINHP